MGPDKLSVVAVALGARLDLKGIEGQRLEPGSRQMREGARGTVVLFRYGAIVGFDLAAKEREALLARLARHVREPFSTLETESTEFRIGLALQDGEPPSEPAMEDAAPERLQIVADVLAKSVALSHYESAVAEAFDRVEPLAVELEKKGRVDRRHAALARHVGSVLLAQQRMVGRIEIGDKPDLLWERPDLERHYAWLVEEYELKERAIALERKLALVGNTTQILLNFLYDRRSLRVEWYIVFLIVVEVLISLWDKLGRSSAP